MNLNHLEYWPGVLLSIVVLLGVTILLERRFFKVIRTYWFFKRSLLSYISTFLYLAGMGLLLIGLMDLRGPEEKIKQEVPSDRTIILLDTSASMLAEDIKPSRLQKAVLIAKHFARKAAGQQIAVVAFAEIQKKIVPFTNDLELIDSRLESLKNIRNQYGSSALSIALQESIQYFKETGDSIQGNILVLTDGEETAEGIDLKVPKEVRVAFVGIGTTQGGRIPMDDSRGFRFGYKKDRGQDVITRFNEQFFKKTVNDIPSAKYWVASSYSLPSEEILEFFVTEKGKAQGEQDMVIRPVLMEWVVVPAILLLIMSYLFKALRIFVLGLALVVGPVQAQKKEPELSPHSIERLHKLQAGKLNHIERLKLADDLYKEGLKPEAMTIYQENLNTNKPDPSVPPEAYLNYGTALLDQGKTGEGLETYDKLLESLKNDPQKSQEIRSIVEKNIVTHFQQMEQKQQQNKDQKNQNQQNQSNDQQDEQQQGQNQDQNQNQGQSKAQQNQQKSGQGDKEKDQSQGKDQEKNQKNQGEEKDKKDESDKDNEKEGDKDKESGEKNKNHPPRKLPAKLKQLMSDDRQLQMKIIENGTRDMNKRKSRRSKDW